MTKISTQLWQYNGILLSSHKSRIKFITGGKNFFYECKKRSNNKYRLQVFRLVKLFTMQYFNVRANLTLWTLLKLYSNTLNIIKSIFARGKTHLQRSCRLDEGAGDKINKKSTFVKQNLVFIGLYRTRQRPGCYL